MPYSSETISNKEVIPIRFTKSLLGGSLCEVIDNGLFIEKKYTGNILRGHHKLINEYLWFNTIPDHIKRNYPTLFPISILFFDQAALANNEINQIETLLLVQKFNKHALTKMIIGGLMSPQKAEAWLKIAITLLIKSIYPLRVEFGAKNLYKKYHEHRITTAYTSLNQIFKYKKFFNKKPIIINGRELPSLIQFFEWLEIEKNAILLNTSKLFCFHGNFHPDNILISDLEEPSIQGVTFIDPRGELLGPAYYDSAKLMTSLHSFYDEIHYDIISIEQNKKEEFMIENKSPYNNVYFKLLYLANSLFNEWSEISGDSIEQFVIATVICQAIHTISLSYYHANRNNPNLKQVETYLLTACYLADIAQKLSRGDYPIEYIYKTRLDLSC